MGVGIMGTLQAVFSVFIAVFGLALTLVLGISTYVVFHGQTEVIIAGRNLNAIVGLFTMLGIWYGVQRAQAHWQADFMVGADQKLAAAYIFLSLVFVGYVLAKLTPDLEQILFLGSLVGATVTDWVFGFGRRSGGLPGIREIAEKMMSVIKGAGGEYNIVITLIKPRKGVDGYDVTVERS